MLLRYERELHNQVPDVSARRFSKDMDISYTVYSFLTAFYPETPPSLQIVSSHV